ncbi:hypothetical protein CR205_06355 [Alteribacter lacisalsi]|uniref:Uncharacterized protein n=1 Tax=Alteribacter lacisalsi TaxID=2045244 RepID=A0A2W0H8M1_9BACI|nr:hypothetical protein [Alteribacter lacisalsi]PYZ98213.1 hypothetical protein CR205_06355 [Alteribacter lacisalsi]
MNKLTQVSRLYGDRVNGALVIASTLLFFTFMFTVLPAVSELTHEETGSSESPDSSYVYSSEDLYRMAEAYGESGRTFYIESRFTFDIAWPAVYLFFLATLLSFLWRGPLKKWEAVNLIPAGAFICDMMENTGASIVMARYPEPSAAAALITPLFTFMKWNLIYISFALIAAGILLRLYFRFKKRKNH